VEERGGREPRFRAQRLNGYMLSKEDCRLWGITEETPAHVVDAIQFLSTQTPRKSTHRCGDFEAVVRQAPARPDEMGGQLPYVHEREIGDVEFAQSFLIPNRPCMVRGCSSAWGAARKWNSPSELGKWYGGIELRLTEVVGSSAEAGCRPVRIPLANYLPYASGNKADFPWYAFDDDFGCDSARAALLRDFETPRFFRDDCYAVAPIVRERMFPKNTFFVVGGARTGTVMHVDPHETSAWNTLLCGRKRWILIPPTDDDETLEAIGLDRNYRAKAPPCQWWADTYPELVATGAASRVGAIECIQEAGDTIYVPRGWWHTVLNLDVTIAITANFLHPSNLAAALGAFRQLATPMPKKRKRLALLGLMARRCIQTWPQLVLQDGDTEIDHLRQLGGPEDSEFERLAGEEEGEGADEEMEELSTAQKPVIVLDPLVLLKSDGALMWQRLQWQRLQC